METSQTPKFATIDGWCPLSGMGRRVVYDEIGLGNIKAIKVGARTLIDVGAGLAWLRSRPAANIRAPRQRNTEAASASAARSRASGCLACRRSLAGRRAVASRAAGWRAAFPVQGKP